MKKHYHAGYITDTIASLIDKVDNETLGLLKHITAFDVVSSNNIISDEQDYSPVLAVLNNLICRGLPTKAPMLIEDTLVMALNISQKNKSDFEEKYELLTNASKLTKELVKELLHIVEPQHNISRENYDGKLDSHAEWKFIDESCAKKPVIKQILQPQRPMFSGAKTVDFAFQSPYLVVDGEKKYNFIFEIDGPHHDTNEIKVYDKYRDSIATKHDFKTYRESLTEKSKKIDVKYIFDASIFSIFEKNYNRSIDDFIKEYIIIFTPLSVARIQKTLIEYFLANTYFLKRETLKMLIIERDVPCAALAIQSLQQYIDNINAILEEKSQLFFPKIDLQIITDKRFDKFPILHLGYNTNKINVNREQFDIIIDHSILRRSGIFKETSFVFDSAIKIRSSHYSDTSFGQSRRVYCAKPLEYKDLVIRNPDGSYTDIEETKDNINFFIKDIFRKTQYRDGQLPIISRALRQLPVIGLLPTGGGKSITFQLSALLQPGLCLIVNPIKSLMEDQVRVLKNNWIDCCSYINSTLKRGEKVKNQIDFMYGESQFMFVSPERFVMEEFRKIVRNINSHFGLAITYCVIDEVHCVSEWGHDFRTTYLSLGKNVQKFCASRNKNGTVALIGLTATASFDVLADIDRELQIDHNDIANATIMIENTIRPELFFSVTDIGNITLGYKASTFNIRNAVGEQKQKALNNHFGNFPNILKCIDNETIIASLRHHFKDFELINEENISKELPKLIEKITHTDFPKDSNAFSSVHFCPHKSGILGVTNKVKPTDSPKELFENLNATSKGFYMGSSDDDGLESNAIDTLDEQANNFLHSFLGKEGEIKHIVCTKAFGMGIDKQDIRAVYHINFSNSPESYIQEAGRAGRDKKVSICHLLYSNQTFFDVDRKLVNNLDLTIKERKIVRALFEDIWIDKKEDNFTIKGIFDFQYFTKESLLFDINQLKISEEKKAKLLDKIVENNIDKSVHDFFQDNTFKGVDAEINQIWKLLNTDYGYSYNKLEEIENEFNEGEYSIKLNLTTIHDNPAFIGTLWINDCERNAIGRIKTQTVIPAPEINGATKPNLEITTSVFNIISEKHIDYTAENGEITLFDFLKIRTDAKLNGEDGTLVQKWNNSKSSFVYKFPQNPKNDDFIEKIINGFGIKKDHLSNILSLFNKSIDFTDFIHRLEEYLNLDVKNSEIYQKNSNKLKWLYEQQISKGYTARLIYRLMQIGMISDYTIDYRLKIFNCTFEKLSIDNFIENTEKFLAKYTSKENAVSKRKELEEVIGKENDEFKKNLKCVKTVIEFTYKEVVAKRKKAVVDLQDFIRDSINRAKEKSNTFTFKDYWYDYYFKEEMYYYFNAKYARIKFEIDGIDYSLLSATDEGKKSDWGTFEKFADIIGKKGGFITDAKMMRGSCRKIWRNMVSLEEDKEWVLKLLYAYSTYSLNDSYYIHEANQRFIEGFLTFIEQNQKSDYEDFKIKVDRFNEFVEKHVKNGEVQKNYERARELVLFQAQLKYTNQLITKHQEKVKGYGTI